MKLRNDDKRNASKMINAIGSFTGEDFDTVCERLELDCFTILWEAEETLMIELFDQHNTEVSFYDLD